MQMPVALSRPGNSKGQAAGVHKAGDGGGKMIMMLLALPTTPTERNKNNQLCGIN